MVASCCLDDPVKRLKEEPGASQGLNAMAAFRHQHSTAATPTCRRSFGQASLKTMHVDIMKMIDYQLVAS